MYSTLSVTEAATDSSLLTLYDAKLALNISNGTLFSDEQIELFIRWASDEIATMCMRVFAKETVVETFYQTVAETPSRLYLSRWPVTAITSVTENGEDIAIGDYDIDAGSGCLMRIDQVWTAPVTVDYTGGYELPFEAPLALRQAALMMTREAYNAAVRGDSTVRMISHKDSRIIYFDPNAASRGVGGSASQRTVRNLLQRYMRFEV